MKRIRTNRRWNHRGSLKLAFLDILEPRNLLSGTPTAVDAFGQIPLSFEVNQGQTDAQVKFLARGANGTVFFTPGATVLSLAGNGSDAALYMSLGGANPNSNIVGLDKLSSVTNNFVGNDPSKWQTNIANYGRVEEQGIYPGIDLSYYGNNQQLEYDFNVSPGADPNAIRMSFQGAQSTSIDSQGNLVLQINGSSVVEHAPVLYQVSSNGQRESVSGHFVIEADGQVGFAVGAYDASRALVIDPTLDYSTFLGGSGTSSGRSIAVDAEGNAYIAGNTESTTFPTTPGAFQTNIAAGTHTFIAKLNPTGTALVYATYIGGSGPADFCNAIAVDDQGNAYVTGQTFSDDFPTTPGAFQTVHHAPVSSPFVTKLSADGSHLVYSTYLGGSGDDRGYGIAVDSSGSAYVTGLANSSDFPTTSGAFQPSKGSGSAAFVAKLNPAGSALSYSTFLDGNTFNATTLGQGIAVDTTGNAYVAGYTLSKSFPTTPGAFQTIFSGNSDGFVTKLNPTGSGLVYSTLLGNAGAVDANAIAIDSVGNAYVTGSGVYVTKLDSTGSRLVYSTHFGDGIGEGIAVDSAGNAYVGGYTESNDFPTTPGAINVQLGPNPRGFVTKLDSTGSLLLYSTYLGGNGHFDSVQDVAVDSSGHVYATGETGSANFPTTPGALQTILPAGSQIAFVTKIDTTSSTTTSLDVVPNPSIAGSPVTFTATVTKIAGAVGTPTGSITFRTGDVVLGTVPLINGQAAFTTTSLAVGDQTITAVYSGDLSFATSSASAQQTVLSQAAPAVKSVQQSGFVGPTPMVQLAFSQPLDIVSAQRRRNYLITDFHGHTIGIRSIQYDAVARTITLTLAHRLNSHYNYRLTVKGTPPNGVKSLAGTRLDGTGKGHPGTNYHVIFAKSSPPISKLAAQHANHPRGPVTHRAGHSSRKS